MKVLITGATGLVGSEIVRQCLSKGYTVHFLTTRKSKISVDKTCKGFYWNPVNQEIDNSCLEGVSVIINLAGASISKRWTRAYKKEILESRVASIKLLCKALTAYKHNVSHFYSASALGIYPSSLSNRYRETDLEKSTSFLGKVVSAWEGEASKVADLGISVSLVRIGIVLAASGGALEEMAKPIKQGIGAAIGSGKQWQSWIHLNDLAGLFIHLAEKRLSGIYNAVASNPVSNTEITKSLAAALDKSIFLPNVPEFAIKLVLGEMAAITLESQYLINDKIKETGFEFQFDTLESAFEDLF